jgi:toxin ParE1/3/4
VKYRIEFAPEARDDLRQLYSYIADHTGPGRAMAYIDRIEAYCRGFAEFPERGIRRDDLFPGLRIVGFEQRMSIAFGVSAGVVTFYRFLYGGRDLSILMGDD